LYNDDCSAEPLRLLDAARKLMDTKEIDLLGEALRTPHGDNNVVPMAVPAAVENRPGSQLGRRPVEKLSVDPSIRGDILRNRAFPDLYALGHAIQFAKESGDMEDAARLEALNERSNAFGAGGYGTHLPLLAAVMARADYTSACSKSCDGDDCDGPVLECGAGFYSTTLLNTMCRASSRRLYTLESDPAWLAKFAHLASENHILQRVDGWQGDPWGEAIRSFDVDRWSVVFIDHREKIDRVAAMRDKADFIVVHDTRNSFHAGLDDLLETFRYRFDYTEMSPCTTVVSMTEEFSL
jgi:hypothetical protein